MSTYRPSAFEPELTPDRSGAPDSGPRTPWSPVCAIRGRVVRPLIDLEEPELAVCGTEEQVAISVVAFSCFTHNFYIKTILLTNNFYGKSRMFLLVFIC